MSRRGPVDRVWGFVVSMRTTAALLAALSALMLANVAIPQQGVTPDAYRELVARGRVWRLAVETVGLGHVSTSPAFRVVLWLFFVSLAAVLVDRIGATLRRARVRPPGEAQVRALVERGALPIAEDRGWSPTAARAVLEGLGYRVASAGTAALWAVKNPAAVLGFPLFHLSFFVICAAALQIYWTRVAAVAIATEGQRIQGPDLRVERSAPDGSPPRVDVMLERVDAELRDGQPTDVSAALRSLVPGEPPRVARINHPAEWESLTVLVERVGVAPVLRLANDRGFTVDRVSASVGSTGGAMTVGLAGGRVRATIEPIPIGPQFPMREALPQTKLRARVEDGERVVFDGSLAPGERVKVDGGELVLEDIRYWTSLRFVHEEGGPLLVVGFALLVVGIVWRMVWHRREVVVVWGPPGGARLAGRTEFYPARFQEELRSLRDLLENPGGLGRARREEST